jgi:hypothetical protein
MKAFFYAVESLLLQNNTELSLDNPQFQFIYQVCEHGDSGLR